VNLLIEVWQSKSENSLEAQKSFSRLETEAIDGLIRLIQLPREEKVESVTQRFSYGSIFERIELLNTAQQLAQNLIDNTKKTDINELIIQRTKLKALDDSVSALGDKEKELARFPDFQSAKKRIEGVSQAIENEIRIRRIPVPRWHWWLKVGVAILGVNFILILMAIPIPRVRRIMFHPLGSAMIGVVVGKYLFTDLLIRFVPVIRTGLFRDYRRKLLQAPIIKDREEQLYVPPNVNLSEETHLPQGNEQWKHTFETLLRQPKGRLWLLLGKSGLGKTALLENWLKHALLLRKTPIFIQLGRDVSPEQEAATNMAQYGDIDVKPDVALDLLKDGGFVILLDGFNEDRTVLSQFSFEAI
jgi:hypothetical protein